ncbi:MAG TPA: methyl-accepting chemotaxis protein [Methylothermaceae bacterium]|nr:methyl-accepting chemotaxis protein [Methylothermaceae bacterium]
MKVLFQNLSLGQQNLLLTCLGIGGIWLTVLAGFQFDGWGQGAGTVTVAALASVALFTLAYLMGRHTVGRADQIVTALRALAAGDLSRKLQLPGKDEFAWMAWEYNQARNKVRETLEKIQQHAEELAVAADGLAAVMDQTRLQVRDQGSQTGQLAESMAGMSVSIQQVSQDIATTADEARETDQLAKRGFRQFEDTLESIALLTRKTGEIAGVIDRLQADSSAIDGVMEVIRGIAEQTNLLALNAAIEAARAGEQGRGFAVVAEEVRTLASRTQESTREIQEMIERLQEAAGQAVQSIESGKVEVETSSRRARQAGESLTQILASVDRISQRCGRIATSAMEQSATVEEINHNVKAIHQHTRSAAASAEQTTGASARLAELATLLQGLVNQFKVAPD